MPAQTVAFATPSLTHSVCMEFHRSAMQTDWLLAAKGYSRTYLGNVGNQFIAQARNLLVRDFFRDCPDVENFFFIDDDLGWTPEKVIEFIERDEDILCGVYPKRSDDEDWPVVIAGDDGKLQERDHLVRCVRGPTGFMRIKRRVLEAMAAQAPTVRSFGPNGETVEVPGIFATGVGQDGWFWGEDYVFCGAAAALGFEIWADPDVEFTHRGTKAWSGSLRSKMPIFEERAREAHEQRLLAEQFANGPALVTADGASIESDPDVVEGEAVNRSDAA